MPNLINAMLELRKCCIHPFLLRGKLGAYFSQFTRYAGAEDTMMQEMNVRTQEDHTNLLVNACGKMVLLDKLLKKLQAGGHRVLIFSQMTKYDTLGLFKF